MQSSSTAKEVTHSFSTEGDPVFVPVRCTPSIAAPVSTTCKPWTPFSNHLIFYDPELHYDIAHELRNAPIQSIEKNEEVKSFE